MILAGLFLLVLSVGAVTFDVLNTVSSYPLSKSGTGYPQAESGTVSILEVHSSSLPVSSRVPSSARQSSSSSTVSASSSVRTSSVPASSVPVSSAPTSSAPASSHPMDPAVYQAMYPNLNVQKPAAVAADHVKTVYLTFDDGPSNLTKPLLEVLDRYQVKATFFLVGKTGRQDLQDMKDIVQRGHAIGVHSYTHQFRQIYKDPAAFLDDFAKMHDLILKTTGVDTHIYRFAGGSVNGYNRSTAKAIITEMNRRGYTYYDWNVSSEDAEVGTTAQQIYNNVIRGVHSHTHSVVLCHNTGAKKKTLEQMPKILETLLKEGYTFKTLDDTVNNAPYIFPVPKS